MNGKLSARSTPTGSGSRGGLGHSPTPETRDAWLARMRAWRLANPEYVERDNERRRNRRRFAALERDRARVDAMALTPTQPSQLAGQTLAAWLTAETSRRGVGPVALAEAAGLRRETVHNAMTVRRDLQLSTAAALANALGYELALVRRDRREVDELVARLAPAHGRSSTSRQWRAAA